MQSLTISVVLVLFVGTLACPISVKAAGCVADLNGDFPEPDPLFLRPNTSYDDISLYESAFVLPSSEDGLLHFEVGETVRVACPGSSLKLTGKSEELAVCSEGNTFKVGSKSGVTIEQLACQSSPSNTAIRKGACEGGTRLELGYNLEVFYPLVYTCFNEPEMRTLWSFEHAAAELKGYESGENSPSFKEDDFYPNLDVDALYGYESQIDAFAESLGSQKQATQYIKDHNNYFLARGHFAPRADFVFGAHTRVTFHFVNVAPQWQIFNGGVWNNLEMSVRNYIISTATDLEIYTGPWDVLSLPDTNNNLVPLYLANPGTSEQTLGVPKFYWKLIVEPKSNRGVAFVGINNPFVAIPYPKDYELCTDVTSEISWLHIKNTTWLYACEVADFVKLSPELPQIKVSGLLTD